jgi:hypothetical protein
VVLSSDYGCIRILSDYHGRELKEVLGCGSTTTSATVLGTIYFRDGIIFQDFSSNFLMVYCWENK